MFHSSFKWVAGHALRQAGSSPAGVDFSAGADVSHIGEKQKRRLESPAS
jgi:hypothetical protein